MNYIEQKISEATDSLRYQLYQLTVENLNQGSGPTLLTPQCHVIDDHLTQDDDQFAFVVIVMVLAEEWYRRGVIEGVGINNECDLHQLFEDRTQQIMESFKQWLTEECDSLTS